jgi:bifunctional UDP-N-acetylglucosamine pyrophosphorylase/glucosamine-1-phosphate N-acetyltransferase
MSGQSIVAIVLAAGKGTRMKSDLPKVLHKVGGQTLLGRVMAMVRGCGIPDVYVVVGHGHEEVRKACAKDGADAAGWILQAEQRGTGDAVRATRPTLGAFKGTVVVLSGDVPLLSRTTLTRFLDAHRASGAPASLISCDLEDPGAYGRVIRRAAGRLARIVEARDANPEEKAVREINTGIYCFDGPTLFEALDKLTPANDQGEYYLTDVFGLVTGKGLTAHVEKLSPPAEFMGINNRVELAQIEGILRERRVRELMIAGVTLLDPNTVYVDEGVEVGPDTVLHPCVTLRGKTKIGRGCEVRSHSVLQDTVMHDGSLVKESSVLTEAIVGKGAQVGPFAHLRPGADLGAKAKVGNFVEVKNAKIGDRSKASHLSYIGDATIGSDSNIGAGTITCNYDGFHKHRTIIGSEVFVGSDSVLVAPVEIGDRAFVAAASTVTRDVPADALAIGRARQVNKEGYAKLIVERHESCMHCQGKASHKEG